MIDDEDLLDNPEEHLALQKRSMSYIGNLKHELLFKQVSESKLDLVFLYSDPLLIEVEKYDTKTKKWGKELVEFNEPLETELEFDGIVQALKKTKR